MGYFAIKHWKYFKKGSRIEVKDIIGDVIDVNLISFTLLEVRNWLSSDTDTGRMKLIIFFHLIAIGKKQKK